MATDLELQVRHYWRVMQAAPAALAVSECLHELATLEIMTDSEVLRRTAAKSARDFEGQYKVFLPRVAG